MGEQITIVNFKHTEEEEWDEYIGRENNYYGLSESILANPFTVDDYPRKEAINLYTLYIFYRYLTDEEIQKEVKDLSGKTLACWCKPEDCHGDVLKELNRVVTDDELSTEEYIADRIDKISSTNDEGEEYKKRIKKFLKKNN